MYLNRRRDNLLRYTLTILGVFSVVLALYLSYGLYFNEWQHTFRLSSFKVYLLILCGFNVYLNMFTGFNMSFLSRGYFKESLVVFQNTLIMICGLILILFWMHSLFDSRRLVVFLFCAFYAIFDFSLRLSFRYLLLHIYFKSKFSNNLLLITDFKQSEQVIERLTQSTEWTRKICGVVLFDGADTKKIGKLDVVCSLDKLLAYVSSHSVDEIFICTNNMNFDSSFKETLAKIEETGIKLSFKIKDDYFEFVPHSFSKIDKIGGYYCVSISRNYFSYRNIIAKHVMDFLGGLVGFTIFAIAFCILGPIIKHDSKGPILFKQKRVGRNGRIFTCYKFRSMRQDAEELKAALMKKNEMHGLMFKMDDDPRVTKVGKFIRKTSLDELPQFINVLKGDMSLVGTRPPTVDEYKQYSPKQKARISMTPCLTGLWQVSGRSNIKNFDDVIRLDMLYIDNWSILLDLKIILLTIKVVLFGSGAK